MCARAGTQFVLNAPGREKVLLARENRAFRMAQALKSLANKSQSLTGRKTPTLYGRRSWLFDVLYRHLWVVFVKHLFPKLRENLQGV